MKFLIIFSFLLPLISAQCHFSFKIGTESICVVNYASNYDDAEAKCEEIDGELLKIPSQNYLNDLLEKLYSGPSGIFQFWVAGKRNLNNKWRIGDDQLFEDAIFINSPGNGGKRLTLKYDHGPFKFQGEKANTQIDYILCNIGSDPSNHTLNSTFSENDLMQIFREFAPQLLSAQTKIQQISILAELIMKYAVK